MTFIPAVQTSECDRYNRQVYLVPTDNWQLAVWAATRSTRVLPGGLHRAPADWRTFERAYSAHNYSPVLWYTPGGSLSGEVYDFLHRLPGICRIIILSARPDRNLPTMDHQNLEAMLDEFVGDGQLEQWRFEREGLHVLSFLTEKAKQGTRDSEAAAEVVQACGRARMWLDLHDRACRIAFDESLDYSPRVAIVAPASPYLACAIAPLASYVQARLVLLDPRYDNQDDLDALAAAVVDGRVDEVWLAGPAQSLKSPLRKVINAKRSEARRYERGVTIRGIPGDDHFSVCEQAAVLLLTYRYLDWVLTCAVTAEVGREYFFDFLSYPGMGTLFHYCNRVLDIADQLRRNNLRAIADVHDVFWLMSDTERRSFISQFQRAFELEPAVRENLAVVTDYAADDPVPHHLIDATCFAARRAVPLLLLQPLPAETSFYVGSLMDKIDDRLNFLTQTQIEQAKLDAQRFAPVSAVTSRPAPSALAGVAVALTPDAEEDDGEWEEIKGQVKALHQKVSRLKMELRQGIYKTGEVLYESLVPLAMRKTLHQLCPKYLAVFIQDPSLPVELICESQADAIARGAQGGDGFVDAFERFWSLRYAIGHISSVNFYETNLTSNTSLFTPRMRGDDELRVLLCSNPTRDLYFSGVEAKKIFQLFQGEKLKIGSELVDIGVAASVTHLYIEADEEHLPTRDNLIYHFRKGHDIIHYSGHAFFDNVLPGRSGLLLSDGVLTASDVRFMLDLNRNPIIYANACAAGRIKSVSSRFTGLAAAFIRAGAVGYISPLWSVDDQDASALAAEYYNALLQKKLTIGECLLHAKREQARSGSVTWASLVLYGDPMLSIMSA
jgi:hypothetical protein